MAYYLLKACFGVPGHQYWSIGVLEHWSIEKRFDFKVFLGLPLLHYPITPSLRGKKRSDNEP